MGHLLSAYRNPDVEPIFHSEVFDKYQEDSRPIREMKITSEEMDRTHISREERDYCAHLWMDVMKCRRDWFPEMYRCADLLHTYQHCNVNDIKHRMMEYERTKRLMIREKKKMELEAQEAISE